MMVNKQHPASFRDPAGFIFEHEGKFYRQVNKSCADNYNLLQSSGLYEALVKEKKLLPFTDTGNNLTGTEQWYKTILPEQLPFISYPYEWCFDQWKDAALLTLTVVKRSINFGMILKDATPFNIQFVKGLPIFIDSLSFDKYDPAKPWIAYRQFVECFIAPLLLARHRSPELLKIFSLYPDGIPLKILSGLLPFKSKLNLNVLLHVLLPASLKSDKNSKGNTAAFTKEKLLHIIRNLEAFVHSLKLPLVQTQWNNYYEHTVLGDDYVKEKMTILQGWIKDLSVTTVLDIGTNTGLFAEMTASEGKDTIAVDADIACIERLYKNCKQKNISSLLPLYLDITNPTAAIGWNNTERTAFLKRIKTDLCMALALIHHLAISKNIGFDQLAKTLASISPLLIIEFVPKTDPKIMLLLQYREDIFDQYDELNFKKAFEEEFTIEKATTLQNTGRILFLMKRKSTPKIRQAQ
jgi:hypothetical protein